MTARATVAVLRTQPGRCCQIINDCLNWPEELIRLPTT